MKPFVQMIVTESVADACRRGDPILNSVMNASIEGFKKLGLTGVIQPKLDSIVRHEDEYGEFYTVNFTIQNDGEGA